MALNTVSAAASAVNAASDAWKAKAFINMYLPKADGTKAKVGKGVALTGNSAFEQKLLERLAEDDGQEAFADKVIIEVHFVNSNADAVDVGF